MDPMRRCLPLVTDSSLRFSWNLPYTREVLASTSHLMVCSDKDIYPNFTLDIDLSAAVGGRVVTTLLRMARQVYREYQRALWDDSELASITATEEEMTRKITAVFQARRRRLGREEALAKGERKLVELRGNQFTDEDVVEAAEDRMAELKYEVNEAKGAEAIAGESWPPPPPPHILHSPSPTSNPILTPPPQRLRLTSSIRGSLRSTCTATSASS